MAGEAFMHSGTTANGPCLACYTPTDTGLAVEADQLGLIQALKRLTVPEGTARIMAGRFLGDLPVPPRAIGLRVCRPCAEAAGASVDLMVNGSPVPVYDFTD